MSFACPKLHQMLRKAKQTSAQEVMVSCVLLKLPYILVAVPLLLQIRKCSENYKRTIYSMVQVKFFLKEKTCLTRLKYAIVTDVFVIVVFTRS